MKVGYSYTLALLALTIFLPQCKKFIDVEAPYTSTSQENTYSSDITAISVLTGLYSKMSQDPFDGIIL